MASSTMEAGKRPLSCTDPLIEAQILNTKSCSTLSPRLQIVKDSAHEMTTKKEPPFVIT